MPYGTLSITDLLATTQTSVADFGEDRVTALGLLGFGLEFCEFRRALLG